MTVKEVLEAAREAAIEIRRIEEEAEIRRQRIGVQGHGYDVHSKSGILDPMRKVDDLLEWQESQYDNSDILPPIDEGYELVAGIERISDPFTVEVVTRYYLQGESWREIVEGLPVGMTPISERSNGLLSGLSHSDQIKVLVKSVDESIKEWERIGIPHLKEMGR